MVDVGQENYVRCLHHFLQSFLINSNSAMVASACPLTSEKSYACVCLYQICILRNSRSGLRNEDKHINILAKIESPLRSAKLFPCRLLSLISSINWQSQKLNHRFHESRVVWLNCSLQSGMGLFGICQIAKNQFFIESNKTG